MIVATEQTITPDRQDVQTILDEAFEGFVSLQEDKEDGGTSYRLAVDVDSLRSALNAPPAKFAADELRRLAGQFLAAAEELDVENRGNPEVELYSVRDTRHHFVIPGFEEVELTTFNFPDRESAEREARQALASLTAGRPIRQRSSMKTGALAVTRCERHEFDIGLTGVRLVVLGKTNSWDANIAAHEALATIRGANA